MQREAEDRKVIEQFVKLGAPREQVEAAYAKRRQARAAAPAANDEHLVLPRHLEPALRLAAELRTQVRVAALPAGVVYLGLDYAARADVIRTLGLPRRGSAAVALLAQFKVLEDEMMVIRNRTLAAS